MIALKTAAAALAILGVAVSGDHGGHHPAPHHGYDEHPKPYAFEYGVHDDYSGANFNQHEGSDGKVVSGSYTVLLPDGRTQVNAGEVNTS